METELKMSAKMAEDYAYDKLLMNKMNRRVLNMLILSHEEFDIQIEDIRNALQHVDNNFFLEPTLAKRLGVIEFLVEELHFFKMHSKTFYSKRTNFVVLFDDVTCYGEVSGDPVGYYCECKNLYDTYASIINLYIYILEEDSDIDDLDIMQGLFHVENGLDMPEKIFNHEDAFFGIFFEEIRTLYSYVHFNQKDLLTSFYRTLTRTVLSEISNNIII